MRVILSGVEITIKEIMKKLIITYAVKEELTQVNLPNYDIKYVITGIGKASSAMLLTKAIYEHKPDYVLNIGSAGTANHNIGDVIICNHFIDRDFEKEQLPGIKYEIDLSNTLSGQAISNLFKTNDGLKGMCNTGDSFVTEISTLKGDVVDMESYAQALVCKEFNMPFVSVKYVTDVIGQNSVKHWEDKLADANSHLTEWLKNNIN